MQARAGDEESSKSREERQCVCVCACMCIRVHVRAEKIPIGARHFVTRSAAIVSQGNLGLPLPLCFLPPFSRTRFCLITVRTPACVYSTYVAVFRRIAVHGRIILHCRGYCRHGRGTCARERPNVCRSSIVPPWFNGLSSGRA